MKSDSLRKAAVVIASLDAASADALLDEMDPEEAARVRNAVMNLGEIDPREQAASMQDFMRGRRRDIADDPHDEQGVELDPELVEKMKQNTDRTPDSAPEMLVQSDPERFQCLDGVDVDALANVLIREHPQTTAIVVAHLSAARAAALLRHLSTALRTETLMRVARLGTLDPDVVRDVEQEMQTLLAHREHRDPPAPAGLATVEAILQASSDDERDDLVATLMESDKPLAQQLAARGGEDSRASPTTRACASATDSTVPTAGTYADPRTTAPTVQRRHDANAGDAASSFTFADLETLDDAALAHVLRASSPNTTLLALAGASHDFVQQILAQLPAREAGQLEHKMRQLGPIRLDDVERAQWRLADLAQHLIDDGTIATAGNHRFAAAA